MSGPGVSSFKIADAYVLVGGKLDERSVEQAVLQGQKNIDRTNTDIKVGLDKRSLNTAIATIRGSLRELSKDLQVKISVAVDDKSLAASALKVMAAADDMGRNSPVGLRIDLDAASVVKADLQLKAAAKQMGRNDNVQLKISGGDNLSSADNEVQQFSNHWTRLAALVGTGIALGAGPVGALGLSALIAGWGALAIASEAGNKTVQKSFKDLEATAKETAQDSFEPMIGELTSFASQATTAVQGLKPAFSRAALAISPEIHEIGDDLITTISKAVTGTEPILQNLQPVASALGNSFGTLEHGVSGFLGNINVSSAVQGWNSLAGAVDHIVDPLSLALNAVAPLSNAIINVLGTAIGGLERTIGEFRPVGQAFGATLSLLGPVIDFLGPPVLALGLGTKLLTGTWFDAGAAGAKLKGIISGMPDTFAALANKIGYTTAAQRQYNIGAAQAAVVEAEQAKEADVAAVAEADLNLQQTKSIESSLLLADAKKRLMASTLAATEAEADFDAVSEASSFSFGPLGIALGVIGAGIALFANRSKDASPPVQDLTSDLVNLANAAPAAASGVLSGNQQLEDLINKGSDAGVSMSQLLAAYKNGPEALQNLKNSLDQTTTSLGNQSSGFTVASNAAGKAASEGVPQAAMSIKDLSDEIDKGTVKLSDLPQATQLAVNKYNDLKNVSGQLGTSVGTLTSQQSALNAITGQAAGGIAEWKQYATQATYSSQAFGGSLNSTILDMDRFAASQQGGVFSLESFTKAQVSAAGTFEQAKEQYQQLQQAVTSAGQQVREAGVSVANASHQIKEAADGVADARHSEEQAEEGVTTARTAATAAVATEVAAQKTLVASLAAVKKAEQDVAAARAAAILQLQAESRGVLDQADTQAEAELKLHDAQAAYDQAGLASSNLKLSDLANQANINAGNEQAYQILLQLSEAQHGLNDTTAQTLAINKQNAADQKAGVDGNQDVLSAQQNLTTAQQQAQASATALAQSQAAIVTANKAVAEAQYSEEQAHKAVAEAQYSEEQAEHALTQAKQSQTQATQQQRTAVAAASTSIDINTAAGNRNVTTLIGLYDAQIAAGKSTDQATQIVEQEGQQLGITKGDIDKVLDSVGALNGKQATFGVVGVPSVNVGQLISAAEQQGLDPHDLGFTPSQIGVAGAGQRNVQKPKRDGGKISGPGTSTSDSIWASVDDGSMLRVSKDEFIMNAAATRANFGLLEALNSGQVRGLASGGPVGEGASVLKTNLMLGEVGGMFQALRTAYNAAGVAPKELPGLPIQNPPEIPLGGFSIGLGNASPAKGGNPAAAQAYAATQLSRFGWGADQMPWLIRLWNQESGWINQVNKSSGAYGIPQALPGSKMASAGPDWRTNVDTQINWGLGYIAGRYGSPQAAWSHEVSHNWYDDGGELPPGLSMAFNGTGAGEHKAVFTDDQWAALEHYANTGGKAATEVHHHYPVTVIAQTSQDARMIGAQVAADSQWKSITSRSG